MHERLKCIDTTKIYKKIREFRKLNIRQMTYEEIQKTLLNMVG